MARERVVAELSKGESDLRSTGSGSNSRYYYQITTISYVNYEPDAARGTNDPP